MKSEEKLKELFIRKGLTLATAESCTGGLVAGRITDVPGSSAILLGGVVSYSNQTKERLLGVSHEALEKVGLAEVADHSVKTFSRGMRQRLGVADVLIKNPQLIIMDEPTQGLDPELAREFLQLIRELAEAKITILLSSHLLYQVQEVCDRVGLFHQGHMVLEGTVTELAKKVLGGGYHVRLHANGTKKSYEEELRKLPGVVEVNFKAPDIYTLVATRDLRSEAASVIVHAGGKLTSLDIENLSLDDIYNAYFEEVNHGPRK